MRLGNVFGVTIIMNPFFLLLLVFAGLMGKVMPILLIFALVMWHEFAHTFVAVYHGLTVVEIELLPFGGVARIDELIQMDPAVEKIVAMAGPMSNLILIGIIFLVDYYYLANPKWIIFLIQANAGMALLNLLPALPLDGGRVLRSKLVSKHGFKIATEKAAKVGQIIAILLLFLGLTGYILFNYVNALIYVVLGLFIYVAALKEKRNAMYIFMRYLTSKKRQVRLKRIMATKELVATAESSVGEVLRHLTPSYYHFIWVLDSEGELLGLITEFELINSLLEGGIHGKLSRLVKHKI